MQGSRQSAHIVARVPPVAALPATVVIAIITERTSMRFAFPVMRECVGQGE